MIEQESGQPAVGTQIRCKPPGTETWHWATVMEHIVAAEGMIKHLSFREDVDTNGNRFWSDWQPNEWSRWEPTQLSTMPDWTHLLPEVLRAISRFTPMSGASAMSSCNKQWNHTLSLYTELWRTILMACSGTISYESRTLSSRTQHAFDKLGAAEWRRQGALHMSAQERCAVAQLAGADPHLMAAHSSGPSAAIYSPSVWPPGLPPVSTECRPDADYVEYTLEVWEHPAPKLVWVSTIGSETWRKADGTPLSSVGWAHYTWSATLEEAILGKPTMLLTQAMDSCRYRGTRTGDAGTVNVLRVQYGTVSCGAADDTTSDSQCAEQSLKVCLEPGSTRSLHFVIFARSPLGQFEETPVWELTINDDDLLKAGCVAATNLAAAPSDRCRESCCCSHERFWCMFGKDSGNREYKWFPKHSKPLPVLGRRCQTTAFGNPVVSTPSWEGFKELDSPVHLIVQKLGDQSVLGGVSCMIDDDVWEQLQLQPKLDARWPVHFYVQFSESTQKCHADAQTSPLYPFEVYSLLRGCVGKVLSQSSYTGLYNVKFVCLDQLGAGVHDKEECELVFVLPFSCLDVVDDQERAEYTVKDGLNSNIKVLADSIKHWCSYLEQLGKNCEADGDYERASDVYEQLDRLEKAAVGRPGGMEESSMTSC